jgi:predicted negative regulator of RcsB-dependent stress response
MQGKKTEALESYRRALEHSSTDGQRKLLDDAILRLK